MPNLSVFANALKQFLDAAVKYSGTEKTEEDLARLQTLFAAIELVAPPGITLPAFDRTVWRICRKEFGEASLDGGKTWQRLPSYLTEQIGSLARRDRWVRDLDCIAAAVELQVNQARKSDVTATVAGAPSQMREIAPVDSTEPFHHTPDFRSIRWGSKSFSFTEKQAACVRILFEAWQKGTPELNQVTILAAAESSLSDNAVPRLRDLFRRHLAWDVLIVKGQQKGCYRLSDPKNLKK